MTQSIIANASFIEIIWTLIGLISLFYCARNASRAIDDLAIVRAKRANGRLLILARQARRNELGRALTQLGLVVIGIFSLFAPANPRPAESNIVTQFVTLLVFIGIQVGLAVSAYLDKRDRTRLDNMLPVPVLTEWREGDTDRRKNGGEH